MVEHSRIHVEEGPDNVGLLGLIVTGAGVLTGIITAIAFAVNYPVGFEGEGAALKAYGHATGLAIASILLIGGNVFTAIGRRTRIQAHQG